MVDVLDQDLIDTDEGAEIRSIERKRSSVLEAYLADQDADLRQLTVEPATSSFVLHKISKIR